MLETTNLEIVPQSELNIQDAVEDQPTFVENALIKARHASRISGLPAIADDSGLVVDALEGRPGVHSARYSGDGASDQNNIEKLLAALAGVQAPHRTCRFRCLMVFVRRADDPSPMICEGTLEGKVHSHAQGKHGFGYDPIFFLPQRGCTLAELESDQKNAISHRGQALRCLTALLSAEFRCDDR